MKKKKRSSRRRLLYVAFIILGVALLALGYYALTPKPPTSYTPLRQDEEHIIGDRDAALTIIEYSDYQCPSCAAAQPTLKKILEDYNGKVKLIYRHYPLISIHRNAWKAAEASECAADQGQFWEYSELLFKNQKALSIEDLKRYAQDVGLNTSFFNVCLDTGFMSDRVRADVNTGEQLGVNATPTFIIGDQKLVGVDPRRPYEHFKEVIDKELEGLG